MNIQLIRKLIESNNETCPEFTYSNPLLDKNVTSAISKSFINILKISKENCNANKKLRHAVLENIRKMCKIEPNEHVKIDENLTELLTSYYEKQIQEGRNTCNVDAIDRKLDCFLIRKSKEVSINSSFSSNINPEVAQALINLNENFKLENAITQDIIHWNQDDKKYLKILKNLWNCDKTIDCDRSLFNDISIKIKTEIEKLLVDISYNILINNNVNIEEILNNNTNGNLILCCSVSPECFQICISILNTLFLVNNFHFEIQNLIVLFVQKVKECSKLKFALLYPTHLTHLVTLLDINLDELPYSLRLNYIQMAKNFLKELEKQSENDLILLLSHFLQWDNIYFEQ